MPLRSMWEMFQTHVLVKLNMSVKVKVAAAYGNLTDGTATVVHVDVYHLI